MNVKSFKNQIGVYNHIKHLLASKKEDAEIIFTTSGTTGKPKIIKKNVFEELNKKRGKGASKDKWLTFYSYDKWAFVSVVLHVFKNESTLIATRNDNIKENIDLLNKATHVALTPSVFMLLVSIGIEIKNNIKQVTFGGEYCAQSTLDLCKKYFPKARITHVYAVSEIGDVMSASDGAEGYPYTDRLKKIITLKDGHMFVNDFATNDMWDIRNNRLYFTGRKNDILNIGGNVVNLLEIENFIRKNTCVLDLVAKKTKVPILNYAVILEYVSEKDIDIKKINKLIKNKFSKYHVPIKYVKKDKIYFNKAGKKERK